MFTFLTWETTDTVEFKPYDFVSWQIHYCDEMTIGSKRLVGWFGHFFLEKKKKKVNFLGNQSRYRKMFVCGIRCVEAEWNVWTCATGLVLEKGAMFALSCISKSFHELF